MGVRLLRGLVDRLLATSTDCVANPRDHVVGFGFDERCDVIPSPLVLGHDCGKPVDPDPPDAPSQAHPKAHGGIGSLCAFNGLVGPLLSLRVVDDRKSQLVASAHHRGDLGNLFALVCQSLGPSGLRAGRGKTQSFSEEKTQKNPSQAGYGRLKSSLHVEPL